MGRKSDYTEELADAICSLIADGQSLRAICKSKDMPDRNTVFRWLAERPDFAARYARAREAQGDVMDEMILETALKCTPANAQAARVKIGAFQWRASKLKPKVYGDRIAAELSGPDGKPIEVDGKFEVGSRLAFALRKGLESEA